jgi:hypothetical protein
MSDLPVHDPENDIQRTGEIAPDPAGWIAISLLVVIVVLVALFTLAMIVSA